MNSLVVVSELDNEAIIEQYWQDLLRKEKEARARFRTLRREKFPGYTSKPLGIVDEVRLAQETNGDTTFYIPTFIGKGGFFYHVPNFLPLVAPLVFLIPGVGQTLGYIEGKVLTRNTVKENASPLEKHPILKYVIPDGLSSIPIPIPDPRRYHTAMMIAEHRAFTAPTIFLNDVTDTVERGMKEARVFYSGGNVVPVLYTLPQEGVPGNNIKGISSKGLARVVQKLETKYGYQRVPGEH